jgi:lipopolysaccharide export system ATP-binding protein
MNSLKAENLAIKFKNRIAVKDVSINLSEGEIVGLLGPNGAGKTTTFRLITGEILPDSGKVFLNDVDISNLPMYKRARLGISYLPQEPSAFRKLTTEENIRAVIEFSSIPKDKWNSVIEDLLDEFDMKSRRKIIANNLSGGERRRLEVMRALTIRPHFILLDEPFSGIDPIAVEDLQKIICRLKEKQIGVLITDHNVHETFSIASRCYIINEGTVLLEGTPDEISKNEIARKIFLGQKFKLR